LGFRRADGSPFPVELTSSIFSSPNGSRVASIFFTDLTEQKKMEEALRANEALYHQMFTNHSAIKLVLDPTSGAIVDANLAAVQFYGYSLDQLKQMNINQINIMPPALVAQVLRKVYMREQNYFVFTHRLASGALRDIETYAVPIQAEKRTVLYAIIHDITARRQVETQLQFLSTHDILTGSFNRAFFESEVARLDGGREFPISVMVADVDNMKTTNDTLGHVVGDELLKQTAAVFRTVLRASDIIARIGGDEFAILLPATDAATANQILTRIKDELSATNATHNHPDLQLSIGVATAVHAPVMDTFKLADTQMYADKREHKAS
jgi:diguanylate cyclase (GGDEF)-like protein/PAS domain S-box-containing protein